MNEMMIFIGKINEFNIFAFTMFECFGVYKMESTGNTVFENSIRVEIATDNKINNLDNIIDTLKDKLNQECIMVDISNSDINFR